MSKLRWSRVGLVLAHGDMYAPFYEEALEHAGVRFEVVKLLDDQVCSRFDVLLFCGFGEIPPTFGAPLTRWVAGGGMAVFSGSTWGVSALVGVTGAALPTSRNRIKPTSQGRHWPEGVDSAVF